MSGRKYLQGLPSRDQAGGRLDLVPSGGSYDNTEAEYYFASPEDVEAAEFRAAKR